MKTIVSLAKGFGILGKLLLHEDVLCSSVELPRRCNDITDCQIDPFIITPKHGLPPNLSMTANFNVITKHFDKWQNKLKIAHCSIIV